MNLFHRGHDDAGFRQPGSVSAGELGHTQYGTPLSEVIFADPAADPQKWTIIPTHWGPGFRCADPQHWADDGAPTIWAAWIESTPGSTHPGPDAVAQTAVELRGFAEKFGGHDPYQPFEITTYLYLPDPNKFPIATRVWVDDRPDLTIEQAAGFDGPDALDKPVVEQFDTEALGTGLKVTRHGTLDRSRDDIEGTGIFVAIRYAFAVPGRQAVVTVAATDTDLARMAAAQDDLDEFVRSITLAFADGTPFVAATADS